MAHKPIRLVERKTVEPVKRMVAGNWGWAVHRFPIRGGITMLQAARLDLIPNRRSALTSA